MSPVMTTAKSQQDFSHPDQRWSELIQQMAGGNESSLAEFYDHSNRLVFGLALRIVNDPGAAEEITLDTYQHAWRQARNFDAQRDKPSCWILTIARHQALDRLRLTARVQKTQTPQKAEPLWAVDDLPLDSFMFDEQRQLIRQSLAQLEHEQRELLERAFFDGLTHHKIAVQLSLPLAAVKSGIGSVRPVTIREYVKGSIRAGDIGLRYEGRHIINV